MSEEIQPAGTEPAATPPAVQPPAPPAAPPTAEQRGEEKRPHDRQHRQVVIQRAAVNEKTRTVELAFSSEEPYDRWWGTEILDHGPGSMDRSFIGSGRGPLLVDHRTADQVGVVEEVTVGADRVGRARVRFGKSARAAEIFQDVVDGIRSNVSVGYVIKRMILESEEEGRETYRVASWQPLEISMVSVPADTTVGVGRSHSPTPASKESGMTTSVSPTPAAPPVDPAVQQKAVDDALKAERSRMTAITALAARHNVADFGQEHIGAGTSVDLFKGLLLDKIGNKPLDTPATDLGMSKKDVKRYSILRAARALSNGDWRGAELEREASDEIAKRVGNPARGFYVPLDIQMAKIDGQRDLTLTTPSGAAGSNLRPTQHLGSSFIELLRNRQVVRAAGARTLSGLVGNIAIPKQTAAATAYWVAENVAPTESAQSFGQLTLAPKTVGAFTDISRLMLLQSDPSVEALVRDDLAKVLAIAIDLAAIKGTGSSGQPTGVLNTSGIGSVALGTNGAAPTWASVVNLWKEVAIDNADMGTLSYMTNAAAVAKMLVTPKQSSGVEGNFIANRRDELAGFPMWMTNQVPSNLTKASGSSLSAMIFGNWAELLIGEWGVLDILTDPYTGGAAGTLRIRLLMTVDLGVRHAQSFSAITDMVTT